MSESSVQAGVAGFCRFKLQATDLTLLCCQIFMGNLAFCGLWTIHGNYMCVYIYICGCARVCLFFLDDISGL